MKHLTRTALLLIILTGCSNSQPSTTPKAPTETTTTPTTTRVVQTDGPDQPHNDTQQDILSTETDYTTSQSVATAFGCGWWAQPIRNETLEERTTRLDNLASTQISKAIPELRHQPTNEIIESYPSQTTQTITDEKTETFTVQCATTHTAAQNIINGPYNRTSTITVTQTDNKWEVTDAQLAGLTLP